MDIRTSQDCSPYAQSPFVTSDITPGVMFPGGEVEFNPMTTFFYTDRTLPKKKLTEPEMLEINDLYRVIGACIRELKISHAPLPEGGTAAPETGALAALIAPSPAQVQATGEAAGREEAAPSRGISSRYLAGLGLALVMVLAWIRMRGQRS